MKRLVLAATAALAIFTAAPAFAQTIITQAKALAGGITPGDTPGYPITLSLPGAYRLESNLSVSADAVGIAANNHNIDIDLNGFTISGNGTGGWGVASIYGESRIHDGVINRFRNSGITLRNNAWVIEDMQIVRNAGAGIDATDFRFIRVENSTIAANGDAGIYAGDSAMIHNNIISENGYIGVVCNLNCQITDNKIEGRAVYGIYMVSGYVYGNVVSGFAAKGIFDKFRADVSLVNNTFIDNATDAAIVSQVSGGILTQGNQCIGKPCRAPL